ncbi:hypothetical protein B0H13DRAFT_2371914 [Mycena leptocephala]|nr:hypothetical protein B0H13DRAFT_2371914 [Mycena leptocephala]
MYDDVSYFVRSCIECQKAIKRVPVLPYNVFWQAPLVLHFNLDSIHMCAGVEGMNYIIHAVEPTILWPDAKALRVLDAKFIYEDIANHVVEYLLNFVAVRIFYLFPVEKWNEGFILSSIHSLARPNTVKQLRMRHHNFPEALITLHATSRTRSLADIESLTYLFGLGRGLLHGILPNIYWRNYCKIVRWYRIIYQREILRDEVMEAYTRLCEAVGEFEQLVQP